VRAEAARGRNGGPLAPESSAVLAAFDTQLNWCGRFFCGSPPERLAHALRVQEPEMKSEGVFRFVSIRPPVAAPDDRGVELREEVVARELLDRIDELEDTGSDPQDAREQAAREVFEGESYIAVYPRWPRLRREHRAMRRLLWEASRDEDAESFRRDAQTLLRRVFGEDFELSRADRDDRVTELVRRLWLAYYVNVMLPAERPVDREPLIDWLRFFALLGPAHEGDRAFREALAELVHARPVVPFGLLAPDRIAGENARGAEEEEEEEEEGEERDRRAEVVREIQTLQESRHFLESIHRRKRARLDILAQREREARREEAREDREGRGPGGSWSSVDLLRLAPWRLSESDFEGAPEMLRSLEALGVVPHETDLIEALEVVDGRLATLAAERAALEASEELLPLGPGYARLERWLEPRRPEGEFDEA
jgi:hypothetical protein